MNKKILIIGNSAKEYALAKILSKNNEIYVAPGNDAIKEFTNCLDIRENSVTELLDFAMENDIDLTITNSELAINANIADIFSNNNQLIFAPTKSASKIVYDKALAKKILYKLRIPTPKFGIFEKQNLVMDYIKNLKNPFVIKTNDTQSAVILTSPIQAKPIVDSLFHAKSQKVIIEDYVWGSPFTFYAITDGYKALPIGSSIIHKHSLEGEGGQLTEGMGATSPNYKLSNKNEYYLMDEVIYPTLEYIEQEYGPYVGIIGINGILAEDEKIYALGYESFLQNCDSDAILNLISTDLYALFESCSLGSFSDEIDFIPQKDLFATSLVLNCKNKNVNNNIINGLDNLDETTFSSFYPTVTKNRYLEFEATTGPTVVLTTIARTITSSTSKIYEEAKEINFEGISYRSDIGKPVESKF